MGCLARAADVPPTDAPPKRPTPLTCALTDFAAIVVRVDVARRELRWMLSRSGRATCWHRPSEKPRS